MKLLFIPIQATKKKGMGWALFTSFQVAYRHFLFSTLLSIVLFVVVFTISYYCTIFSPEGNLFYIDSSFHCGKLPDEIQTRQNRIHSLSKESALKSTVIILRLRFLGHNFNRLFHTERSWHTYRFTVVFFFWSAGFALCARAFSLNFLKRNAFCYG